MQRHSKNEYLTLAGEQIRWGRARTPLLDELETHINDRCDALCAEGIDKESAEERAVFEMGDPVSVGAELDKLHRPRPNWLLLGGGAALFALLTVAFLLRGAALPSGAEAVITTSTDTLGNVVTHLYKKYSDNFIADTDLLADAPESAATYYAGYTDFDGELLRSLFMGDIETDCLIDDDGSYMAYYDWTDNSKKDSYSSLHIYNTINLFYYMNSVVGDVVKYPTENFHTYQSIKGSVNNVPLYETVYKTYELDFMSREEAVEYIKENYLDKLGCTVSDEVEIYAIDHKTMQAHQDSEIAITVEQGYSPYDHYKIKDTFTEDDDFYILCFTVEQNGIELSSMNYFTLSAEPEGRQMMGAQVRVHLNRDGVFYFECSGLMQQENTETKAEKLLTEQEAMDIAYKQYKDISPDDSVALRQIDFEYVSAFYNDNHKQVMLAPTWIMLLTYTSAEGPQWTETLSINAVTGEKIK